MCYSRQVHLLTQVTHNLEYLSAYERLVDVTTDLVLNALQCCFSEYYDSSMLKENANEVWKMCY